MLYEYGATGERTKLVYPDGRKVTYNYDEKLQLSCIIGNGEETRYTYDELGRLSQKIFANGVIQGYTYMPGGNLASMESSDKQGVLDKYFYSYNNAGLISGIDRNRRGLDKVSGRYEYSYDAIGRLTKSVINGQVKASYEYDAFGNRTAMSEMTADTSENVKTSYTYDVLDRLIETKELNNSQAIHKTYDYDKRGNQTREYVNGLLQKTFTFDVTNMLSKVVDKDKGELENFYNGLGFRVASIRPEERIEYLCDLSKDYYNLLERTVNGETESFVYDNNVISMSKAGSNFYYLQDELGSPMYMTGTDGVAVSSYAFDDFGRNIDPFTGKIKENNKRVYTKQGNIIQPFAFTGYQEDAVSGLKFAQARYYSAEKGRFVGEDQIGGLTETPDTQNKFIYCWNDPKKHVDRNGKFPQIIAGILIGGAIGAVVDAVSQGVAIAKGEQESFDWGKLAGATVEGAVVGGLASTGLGACFAGSMLSGGVGALAGNVTTQLINNGIGKVATKVAPKVLPKIASKVDDFAAKVKAFRNGGSAEALQAKKPMFEYNLQFFAEKGGGCPYENSTTSSKLYSFGNKTAPRGARPMQDFGVESFDSIVKAQSGPLPSGASNVLDVADAPLSGHFHMLPEGTSMPDGLGVIADGVDIVPNSPHGAGHHTIYPTKDMTVNEFNDLYKSLPWEYGGKK